MEISLESMIQFARESVDEFEEYEDEYTDRVREYHSEHRRHAGKPVTVYRGVLLDAIEDLDMSRLGIFWSFYIHTAKPQNGKGAHVFTLEAVAPYSSIDWEQGLYSFVLYGKEQWECYVSPRSEVQVLRVWKDGHPVRWSESAGNTGVSSYAVWGWD
jgi:hypothetical protein